MGKRKRKLCGSQNVSNFRKNLERGLLPSKSSITYEGLYNTYFFDTGVKKTEELVSANYCVARCPNAMTGEVERFVSLGLNSSEDGKNHREALNLVVVLDISGSMGSSLNMDILDRESQNLKRKTKMDVAKEVLTEMVGAMDEKERFGIVLFDNRVEIMQPLRRVGIIDRDDLVKSKIEELAPRGGTNMEIGYRAAMEMLEDIENEDEKDPKNNRIIFITDAHPNVGGGSNTLVGLSQIAAKKKIYTTYIGVGLDFNSKLIDQISKVRGSNYFSIHSQREFKKILNEDFNYIVTPIAFNCLLFFESEGLEIEKCYGTPFSEESSSVVTKIDTVGAAAIDNEGCKGSIVLLQLKDRLTPNLNPSQNIKLTLRYELPNGEKVQNTVEIDYGKKMEGIIEDNKIYENSGIRKAILLAKYASLMRDTIDNANQNLSNSKNDSVLSSSIGKGGVTNEMKDDLRKFKKYFTKEMEILGDKKLSKEMDALDRLIYMK